MQEDDDSSVRAGQRIAARRVGIVLAVLVALLFALPFLYRTL